MLDQLVKIINKVGMHNVLQLNVDTEYDEVKRIRVLVREGADVLIVAAGRQCRFELHNGDYYKHKLSVDIGDVTVYTYTK